MHVSVQFVIWGIKGFLFCLTGTLRNICALMTVWITMRCFSLHRHAAISWCQGLSCLVALTGLQIFVSNIWLIYSRCSFLLLFFSPAVAAGFWSLIRLWFDMCRKRDRSWTQDSGDCNGCIALQDSIEEDHQIKWEQLHVEMHRTQSVWFMSHI